MTDRAEKGPLGHSLGGGIATGTSPIEDAAAVAVRRGGTRLDLGAASWALYQGARDPYVILIVVYVFFPYFATTVVGDAVRGQARVADLATACGLCVACTAPLLGASIDNIGRRKPMLLLMTVLMVPLLASLWWVKPGPGGIGVGVASVILFTLGLAFAYSELLHNSLLTVAATPRQIPKASGYALSLGNLVSVVMLVFVLLAFALPGKVHWPFIPARPLFGLDPVEHQTDRIVGPLVAVVLVVLGAPIFVFTRDASPGDMSLSRAFGKGWASLKATLEAIRGDRSTAVFLVSRMLYQDGMTAILVFMGVFASGVMHWHTMELLAYGVLLSTFAVIGGQAAVWLDEAAGSRRAVQIEILAALLGLICMLGMGANQILFLPYDPEAHLPLWNGPMFRTLPELMFLAIGSWNAVFITAQIASSRTFLTRLMPPDRTAAYFGLYALSGTVTSWVGSLLVRVFTGVFHSQQAGFVPVAILLLVGLAGLFFIRDAQAQSIT